MSPPAGERTRNLQLTCVHQETIRMISAEPPRPVSPGERAPDFTSPAVDGIGKYPWPTTEAGNSIILGLFIGLVVPLLQASYRTRVIGRERSSIDIAISHAMFGRLARRQKGRVGGTVWYLDCELAEGYAVHEPKAFPRPRLVAEGSQVSH